jgi:hypothetical protein
MTTSRDPGRDAAEPEQGAHDPTAGAHEPPARDDQDDVDAYADEDLRVNLPTAEPPL